MRDGSRNRAAQVRQNEFLWHKESWWNREHQKMWWCNMLQDRARGNFLRAADTMTFGEIIPREQINQGHLSVSFSSI
jgi:hypothetical protein